MDLEELLVPQPAHRPHTSTQIDEAERSAPSVRNGWRLKPFALRPQHPSVSRLTVPPSKPGTRPDAPWRHHRLVSPAAGVHLLVICMSHQGCWNAVSESRRGVQLGTDTIAVRRNPGDVRVGFIKTAALAAQRQGSAQDIPTSACATQVSTV